MADFSPPNADVGPYKETAIRIIHENQHSDQGDEFGVTLRTHETIVNDEIIRQHFLVDVERRGPANKMRIKDDDKIVLLNNIFVPEKTHNEIIHLFHHVKVDGKTRFRLVIQRNKKERTLSSGKTYEWMETSAILAPDFKETLGNIALLLGMSTNSKSDDQPIVEKVESKILHSNGFSRKSCNRYRTRSRGLFIDISEHGLSASKHVSTSGDRTKIIMKSVNYTQDSWGKVTYCVSLSDIDQKRYIFIGNDGATLKEHPDWFRDGAHGSKLFFVKNEMYLACNENSGKIVVSKNKYRFEELPVHAGVDCLDSGTGFTMDCTSSDPTTVWNPTRPNTRCLQLS